MHFVKRSLLPLLLLGVLSCVVLSADDSNKGKDPTVYVTKTGKKYHGDGCQYLRKSQIPKTLKEAVAAGYTACSRCKPPTAGGSAAKQPRPKSRSSQASARCAATTKKGSRCKRKASSGSRYCWQHG